jgi:hypothetical protein
MALTSWSVQDRIVSYTPINADSERLSLLIRDSLNLLAYQELVKVLETHAPGITVQPSFGHAKIYTLRQLANMTHVDLSLDKIDEMVEDLNSIGEEKQRYASVPARVIRVVYFADSRAE